MKKNILLFWATLVVFSSFGQPISTIMHNNGTGPGGNVIRAIDNQYAVVETPDVNHSDIAIVPIGVGLPVGPYSAPSSIIQLPADYYIKDIWVLDDMVFMCGYEETSTIHKAWCGHVRIYGGIFSTFLSYYSLNGLSSANKIVAYSNGTSTDLVMCATEDVANNIPIQYLVRLNYNGTSFSTSPDYAKLPYGDWLYDMTMTDDYVIVTGEHYNNMSGYFILRSDKTAMTFAPDFYDIATPEYCGRHNISCTATVGNEFAIAYLTDYYRSPLDFVVKLIRANTMTDINRVRFKGDDKVLHDGMTFSRSTNTLVLLIKDQFFQSTPNSTFVYLQPYGSIPAATNYIYANTGDRYCHISRMGDDHFLAASPTHWALQKVSVVPNIAPSPDCFTSVPHTVEASIPITLSFTVQVLSNSDWCYPTSILLANTCYIYVDCLN